MGEVPLKCGKDKPEEPPNKSGYRDTQKTKLKKTTRLYNCLFKIGWYDARGKAAV